MSLTLCRSGRGAVGRVDGQGSAASSFDHPTSLTVDSNGTVYLADYGNNLIRKVTSAGAVTTLAGTGGLSGYLDGTGYLLNPTLFQNPTHPVSDGAGNIYLTDTGNNNIRKIAADGSVTVFAGSTTSVAGSVNGTGTAALFNVPSGLTRDASGNFYVADSANQRIRKISPDGTVVTLAGLLATKGAVDGGGDVLRPSTTRPASRPTVRATFMWLGSAGNHRVIRLVTPGGIVSTYAGTAGESGSTDGMGVAARFNYPRDLALDSAGNLWVADFGNNTIRRIAPGGMVTTVAGLAGATGSADGAAGGARFDGPAGLTVDAGGNVYIADSNNNTIRVLSAAGVVSTTAAAAGASSAPRMVRAAWHGSIIPWALPWMRRAIFSSRTIATIRSAKARPAAPAAPMAARAAVRVMAPAVQAGWRHGRRVWRRHGWYWWHRRGLRRKHRGSSESRRRLRRPVRAARGFLQHPGGMVRRRRGKHLRLRCGEPLHQENRRQFGDHDLCGTERIRGNGGRHRHGGALQQSDGHLD